MKSLEELAAIRDKMKQTVNTREAAHDSTRVVVGMATCGIAAGARPVLNAFTEEVAQRDLHERDSSPRRAASASASTSRWWRSSAPARKRSPM